MMGRSFLVPFKKGFIFSSHFVRLFDTIFGVFWAVQLGMNFDNTLGSTNIAIAGKWNRNQDGFSY